MLAPSYTHEFAIKSTTTIPVMTHINAAKEHIERINAKHRETCCCLDLVAVRMEIKDFLCPVSWFPGGPYTSTLELATCVQDGTMGFVEKQKSHSTYSIYHMSCNVVFTDLFIIKPAPSSTN